MKVLICQKCGRLNLMKAERCLNCSSFIKLGKGQSFREDIEDHLYHDGFVFYDFDSDSAKQPWLKIPKIIVQKLPTTQNLNEVTPVANQPVAHKFERCPICSFDCESMCRRIPSRNQPKLRLFSLDTKKEIFLSKSGAQEWVIGREHEEKEGFYNAHVSRRHCVIYEQHTQFFVVEKKDLPPSTNGTFVNGVKLTHGEPCEIIHGQNIVLGNQTFVFYAY